jgi:hypothetical protein
VPTKPSDAKVFRTVDIVIDLKFTLPTLKTTAAKAVYRRKPR